MKACSIVATSYGFEMGDGIVTRENNCKLTTKLKEKSAFGYCEGADCQHEFLQTRLIFTSRNPCCGGIYWNKAIQQIINEVLFKNKADKEIKWEKFYNLVVLHCICADTHYGA